MALTSGTKLGPYEILSPLGAGGMGEVYRARDTRLDRDVAVKVLPANLSSPNLRQRLEREAKAVSKLSHPHICTLYDIGHQDGVDFLVMELVEGETLEQRLTKGPLPPEQTVRYAAQIADALANAHKLGITHRDLKPSNVMLTKLGAKLMDFGLAKESGPAPLAVALTEMTTEQSKLTGEGTIVGTFQYMAPEQLEGKEADARTDIFALGEVIYEMATGKPAFGGKSRASLIAAILTAEPPSITQLQPLTPPVLERVVKKCLAKDPDDRWQSASDLASQLSWISTESRIGREDWQGTQTQSSVKSGAVRAAAAPRRVPLLLWLSIALAVAIVAGVTWFVARRPPAKARTQFAIPVPGEVSHMALSRDGSMLAFVSPEETSGLPMLFVQHIGSPSATLLPETEGASYPFWSPDGANVAFFANGKLEKIAVLGGAPQALATVLAARGGSWGQRDVIIYTPDASTAIWRINADGTGASPLTSGIMAKEEDTHRWPIFLPDGNHFLFWAGNFGNTKDDRSSGIYASSLDRKERKLVTLAHSSFGFDSNHLFYADDERQLVSVTFDPSTATLSGSTSVVANVVGFQPSTYWVALTVAENGTLIYDASTGAALSALTWMDRTGKELGRVGDPAVMCNPSLSPDGSRVALDISDQKANNVDIWLESATGAGNSRFTFDPGEEVVGVWSRDGNRLAYRENLSIGAALLVKRATGLEREKQILKVPPSEDIIPNSWSRDDQQVLCTHPTPSGSRLELIPAAGGSPTPFLSGKGSEMDGQISPDGRWAAYASDESGNWEIYVTTFPGAAGKWQVSRGGGTEPRWRGDGNEIFYIGFKGMLMAVPVSSQSGFSTGTPAALFQTHGRAPISSTDVYTYDVTKDGKRFLVNRYVKPDHVAPLTIVLHAAVGNPSL
jgi:eukaryotic-like serine/threonine-protein kinase